MGIFSAACGRSPRGVRRNVRCFTGPLTNGAHAGHADVEHAASDTALRLFPLPIQLQRRAELRIQRLVLELRAHPEKPLRVLAGRPAEQVALTSIESAIVRAICSGGVI